MRAAGVLVVLGLLAASGIAAFALAGTAAPAQVRAGRMAEADLSVPDADLVPVVGLAPGARLLGFEVGAAPERVLAVPLDAPEDLGALQETGRAFSFVDPNGLAWTVTEYEASWGFAYGTSTAPMAEDATAGAYNFVLLVDQTKTGPQVRVIAA